MKAKPEEEPGGAEKYAQRFSEASPRLRKLKAEFDDAGDKVIKRAIVLQEGLEGRDRPMTPPEAGDFLVRVVGAWLAETSAAIREKREES